MHVLSVIHGSQGRTELFAPVIEDSGHTLEEWSFVRGTPPPGYDAVLVFGGTMHADQDHAHPWLGHETAWLRELLANGTPTLGICLGVQLLARAAGAAVGPLPGPEIGWCGVRLTDAGVADPVLGALPREFEALQWHHYTYDIPAGAVELARSAACTQALRLGDACWGVQFHPEVTRSQLEDWAVDADDPPPDPNAMRASIPAKIDRWNELGRALCSAFLDAAEHVLARAA